MLLAGSWRDGLREAWFHPWRLLRDATVQIDGTAPTPTAGLRSPSLGERSLEMPRGCERWTAAAAHAAFVWEIAAPDATIEARLVVDMRVPGERDPVLRVERVAGGVRLSRSEGPAVELLLACGETIDADGPRVVARGRGMLRLIVVAGVDAAELARARERVERRGLAAIAGERGQHSRLIADYGTAIESDAPGEAAAFEWAKVAADGLMVDLPDRGRSLAAAYRDPGSPEWETDGPIVWATGDVLVSLGRALLAAGLREPVRDALRSPGGAALADVYSQWTGEVPPGGPGPADVAPGTIAATVDGPMARAAWEPILHQIGARWGVRPDAGAALVLRPALPPDRGQIAVRRLRVGSTVMDLEARRRFDRVIVRLHRRHGPPLPVDLELEGSPPIGVTADGEVLPGTRAVVAVSDRHEVLFQF